MIKSNLYIIIILNGEMDSSENFNKIKRKKNGYSIIKA